VSEAIARSARQRTESRGAHSRLDYPATDDRTWGDCNSVVEQNEDGSMRVYTTAIPTMREELDELLAADHAATAATAAAGTAAAGSKA
jgi:succinate dehydrogenase / fumarate reductase flavoprotein subunit